MSRLVALLAAVALPLVATAAEPAPSAANGKAGEQKVAAPASKPARFRYVGSIRAGTVAQPRGTVQAAPAATSKPAEQK